MVQSSQYYPRLYNTLVHAYSDEIIRQLDESSSPSLYFVTTTFNNFDCAGSDVLKRKAEYVLKQYDKVYRHLISRLIKNFQTKPHLHPRTFDFVDLPGTRHTSSLNVHEPDAPHLHSIYLVAEPTLSNFEKLRSDGFREIVRHPSLSALQSIDAVPIVPSTLTNVVGYSAKFLRNPAAHALLRDTAVFTQYPLAHFERQQRGADLKYARTLRGVEALLVQQVWDQQRQANNSLVNFH